MESDISNCVHKNMINAISQFACSIWKFHHIYLDKVRDCRSERVCNASRILCDINSFKLKITNENRITKENIDTNKNCSARNVKLWCVCVCIPLTNLWHSTFTHQPILIAVSFACTIATGCCMYALWPNSSHLWISIFRFWITIETWSGQFTYWNCKEIQIHNRTYILHHHFEPKLCITEFIFSLLWLFLMKNT